LNTAYLLRRSSSPKASAFLISGDRSYHRRRR